MRKYILTLFILVSPASFGQTDAEIEEFFTDYVTSYAKYFDKKQGGDISIVLDHFADQTLQVPPNVAPRLADGHAVLGKGFSFFLNSLDKKGAAGIRWEKVQYVKLGQNHALASNIANVYNQDGAVIDRRSSVYSLYKYEDGWKIFMIQSISPDQTPFIYRKESYIDD